MRDEGIIMPESLIARYQDDDEPKKIRKSTQPKTEEPAKNKEEAQVREEMPVGNSEKPVVEKQSPSPEKIVPPLDDLLAPVKKPPARSGGFEIRPDTPKGEL